VPSAWDDPRSRAHVATLERGARWAAVATLLLLVLVAVLGWRAQSRADRLAREGVADQAVVVDRYARGKSHYVALRYAGREVPVRVGGSWGDPYDGYLPGSRVAVRYDPQDPTDVRTAADWNSPDLLVVPAVLGTGLLLATAAGAAATMVHVRRLEARLRRSTWQPVAVQADGTVAPGVPLPSGLWPVPRTAELLVPPAGRTEVVLVGDRLMTVRRRAAAAATGRGAVAPGG
jgi:hypothetical protein